jgi:hypothetical protein
MAPNPNQQITPATYLRTISIIHVALIAGQVLFAIVALVQTRKLIINVRYMRDPLLFVIPLAAVSGFIASNALFKKKVSEIDKTASLKTKLMAYQGALIIRFACLEAPSLFGIVVFLITGQLLFLLISAAIILYFIYVKPSKQNIQDDLQLSYQELNAFSQPNDVL